MTSVSYIGAKGHVSSGYRRPAHSFGHWWTPERVAKLRYIMEKYNDPYKAGRVLGCSPVTAMSAWREQKRKDAEAGQ